MAENDSILVDIHPQGSMMDAFEQVAFYKVAFYKL